LKELVPVTNIDMVIKIGAPISEDLVVTDPDLLTDVFIDRSFNLNDLKRYFNDDAWLAVQAVVKAKITLSTCVVCSKLCFEDCIQCTNCHRWFHYACEGVDADSSDTNATSIWQCCLCLGT
jgi:hypothetical protein